jgi:hypothetical protein
MNPHNYDHLIFHIVPKIYDGEKTAFSTWKSGYHMQKTESRSMSFTAYKYELKVD